MASSHTIDASQHIRTTRPIHPMCYAYTTPRNLDNEGWVKIGYTDKQSVEARIKQQTHTAGVSTNLEWKLPAIYDDGSGDTFSDHDFHRYLTTYRNIERRRGTEWFRTDGATSKTYFYEFRERGEYTTPESEQRTYTPREEQERAVGVTAAHFRLRGTGSQFLWNAKPRFGKTLAAYHLVKEMGFQKILVLTNRPAIATSWADDFEKFMSGRVPLRFVSDNDSLKHKIVHSYKEHQRLNMSGEADNHGFIAFESLQGLKTSMYFSTGGRTFDKLKWMSAAHGGHTFDLLILDEAHEGIDTELTEFALDKISRTHTLHLSGTPFKTLAGESKHSFSDKEIFNWSYADEQEAKENWERTNESANPYSALPRLNMFTYQISPMLADTLAQGTLLEDGNRTEWAFDLNNFFAATDSGTFKDEESVRAFLDLLSTGTKYPYSTPELREEMKHTLWILDRVNSAKALAKLLKEHETFKEYEIVLAAGDGKTDDSESVNENALKRVRKAITNNERTITLSVGQLTVGVTVPEWTGVLMLCNWKSPAAYMQAAFRVQNPYEYRADDGTYYRKENSYLFDFDPARTLTVYDEFAANLAESTRRGGGSRQDRKDNIDRLLNFFPVIGEDENGQMIELDAHKVLSIPRKLKSAEVVRCGFMNNYLFANISNIFAAPGALGEIIEKLHPAKEAKVKTPFNEIAGIDDLHVGEDGEISIPESIVIGKNQEIFGAKIYETCAQADSIIENYLGNMLDATDSSETHSLINKEAQKEYVYNVMSLASEAIYEPAKDAVGVSSKDVKQIKKLHQAKLEREVEKNNKDYEQTCKIAEQEYKSELKAASSDAEKEEAEKSFSAKIAEAQAQFVQKNQATTQQFIEQSHHDVIDDFERRKEEATKREGEETFRAHLRGFSRTIPSFIMAYGDENMTLANFDDYTDDDVFEEITGITEEDFRKLRDGYWTVNENTGESEWHKTSFFDETVFNDSIKEFLKKKEELANYFDETHTEDIFDYIPPQKTNQIFVPRSVVRQMVDALEAENPGCFDNPEHTFADLHIKSGMYITEIVKRLYASQGLREAFPDDKARLHHIFTRQVYGIAPTRIIQRIATNYILGFDDALRREVEKLGHIAYADTETAAKEGRLPALVEELFG